MKQKNTIREIIFLYLFKISEDFYRKIFKRNKQAWTTTKADLKKLDRNTIGFHYFEFLDKNGFDILPKLENHDLFHVITGAKTDVRDELALQFYLLGNGKRSIYQFCVIASSILWLDHQKYFFQSYFKGKQSKAFSQIKFETVLSQNIYDFISSKNIHRFSAIS